MVAATGECGHVETANHPGTRPVYLGQGVTARPHGNGQRWVAAAKAKPKRQTRYVGRLTGKANRVVVAPACGVVQNRGMVIRQVREPNHVTYAVRGILAGVGQ